MKSLIKNKQILIATLILIGFSGWWLYINLNHQTGTTRVAQWFGATYGIMALFGGVLGLLASKKWGGFKSVIGRAIGLIALGLLAQEFGQVVYSYLGFHTSLGNIPYPSIGDIGYFGSVVLYILGAWQLAKATGIGFSLRDRKVKIIATVIPLVLLTASYLYFLKDYQFDFSSIRSSLAVVLDFGYPLGQTTYIIIALMTYLLSKKVLGGIMRPAVLFLLFALGIQYLADFMFLYQNKHGTWVTAGINDLMYLFAYLIMTLALLKFSAVYSKLKLGKKTSDDAVTTGGTQ